MLELIKALKKLISQEVPNATWRDYPHLSQLMAQGGVDALLTISLNTGQESFEVILNSIYKDRMFRRRTIKVRTEKDFPKVIKALKEKLRVLKEQAAKADAEAIRAQTRRFETQGLKRDFPEFAQYIQRTDSGVVFQVSGYEAIRKLLEKASKA